jgi:hypothetical protein
VRLSCFRGTQLRHFLIDHGMLGEAILPLRLLRHGNKLLLLDRSTLIEIFITQLIADIKEIRCIGAIKPTWLKNTLLGLY